MNTTRNKRWNGKIDTLTVDYLNDVLENMVTYGDSVQFGLTGTGLRPNYQIVNAAGKKMAFDSKNHLLHPQEGEFVGSNATPMFTLDQIKTAIAGGGVKASAGTRTSRAGTGGTRISAAKAADLFAAQKYEFFKNNRQSLPAGITEYSDEISELMKNGLSAEDAFGEIVKRHF